MVYWQLNHNERDSDERKLMGNYSRWRIYVIKEYENSLKNIRHIRHGKGKEIVKYDRHSMEAT